MRRRLPKVLARCARRAALLTTLGLITALAAGVGGFLAVAAPTEIRASAADRAPDDDVPLPTEALAVIPLTAIAEDLARHPGLTVGDQPFEASRTGGTASPAEPLAASSVDSAAATVTPGEGDAGSAVRATRAAERVEGTPELAPGDRLTVPVSFYYCQVGGEVAAQGDGGGFCGTMRDGSVVYNGAAACDIAYLGQQFRIEGDPLDRIYRCADTGSAVHGQHRDIWFSSSDDGWAWQHSIGQAAVIEVLP